MDGKTPTAGENVAVLRKARRWGQVKLAREAGISVSYLRKIEGGQRPATPPVVADVARALRVTTQRIYGQPFPDPSEQSDLLNDLRAAVRRHTLPKVDTPEPDRLADAMKSVAELRRATDYLGLLRKLPEVLGQATATALQAGGDAVAWGQVADTYGAAYTVAHRFAQPDLADMIVSRQQWAAMQTWNPEAEVAAAWNEAGCYQSAGQYDDGLAIVERAIGRYEAAAGAGPRRAVALGSLHLRGVVLASRHKDKAATQDHARRAEALAEGMNRDVVQHHLTFGPGNTALYQLAAHVELGQPNEAAEMAPGLIRHPPEGLGPNRLARLYIDVARARLAVNDQAGSEEALSLAWAIAPQMAEIHPMSREVLRVLFVLHQRARPALTAMARRAGLAD